MERLEGLLFDGDCKIGRARPSSDVKERLGSGRNPASDLPRHPPAQGGKRIVEYTDVKRMLLLQKAYTEGGFALAMHAATLHQRKVRYTLGGEEGKRGAEGDEGTKCDTRRGAAHRRRSWF